MNFEDRKDAEKEMNIRERNERRGGQPGAIMDMEEDYDEGDELQRGVNNHFAG